jgi:hypothetical protein
MGLISFVPGVQPRPPHAGQTLAESDNLLYFHHVRKYEPDTYLAAMSAAMGGQAEPPTRLERMYADQIVVSARIADRKFTIFRYAVWITIVGLVTPIVAVLIWYTAHRPELAARRRARAPEPAEAETQPATA